jgi:signal transduction histidine kinase
MIGLALFRNASTDRQWLVLPLKWGALATLAAAVILVWSSPSFDLGRGELALNPNWEIQTTLVALSIFGAALAVALDMERKSRSKAQAREAAMQKLTEELQAAVARLTLATEAGNVAVWDWNLVDNSLIWDDNVYRVYQIPRGQKLDLYAAWVERVHPDDFPRIEAEIAACIKERREHRSAFRVVLPNGDIRHFNTHAIFQMDMMGQATRMIGIDYDVTELVQQRLKAEENEARAIAANRAKSEFLAVVSHELRTPLNAIIGFSDLMVRETRGQIGNEHYRGYIQDIRHSGTSLLSLINDILDLTRIEAGKFDLQPEPIAPDAIHQQVARSLAPLAEARQISLTVTPTDEPLLILGDVRGTHQVMTNLVANGIKFTESGGFVRLAAEAGSGGKTVILSVSDNGRGIPKDRISELCRPFVQISDAMRRDVGGMGLGLAISRSLAEAMGGRLEIESELGTGTVVRVTLPAAHDECWQA